MKIVLIGSLCLAAVIATFTYFQSGEEMPESSEVFLGDWQGGKVWLSHVEDSHYEINWRSSKEQTTLAASHSYPLSIHFEETTGFLEVVTVDPEGGYLFEKYATPEKTLDSVHCPMLSQVLQRVGSSSPLRSGMVDDSSQTKTASTYIKPGPHQIYEVAIEEDLFFELPSGLNVAIFGEEEKSEVAIHTSDGKAIVVGGPPDSLSVMTTTDEEDGWQVSLLDSNFDGIPDRRVRSRGEKVIVEKASTEFTIIEQ